MATLGLKDRNVLFRMTSDQFCALPPSDHFKLELLDGEVIMAARPVPPHQNFIARLIGALDRWIEPRKLGLLYPDTMLKLDDEWTLAPNLCFLRTQHLK